MDFYSIYNRDNTAKNALTHAEKQIGVEYLWGGTTPAGFDCSGLTLWSYATVGVVLPHWTGSQCKLYVLPKGAKLEPGDLLYTEGSDGSPTVPGHVYFYVSPGKILQAPFTGEKVGYAAVDTTKYMVATRPALAYPAIAVKEPTPANIDGSKVVAINAAEATVAVKNGWKVLGWNGSAFVALPSNGVPVGVVKYANVAYQKPKPKPQPITPPTAAQLAANKMVKVGPVDEALAKKNGWPIHWWDGSKFPLVTATTHPGARYANINYKKPKPPAPYHGAPRPAATSEKE